MVNLFVSNDDLESLCYQVEEGTESGNKRLSLLAVATNFHLAEAAFDAACTTTHPHRHLTLRHRARVIREHEPK